MSSDTDPRRGLKRAVEPRPAHVVEPTGDQDVAAAVRPAGPGADAPFVAELRHFGGATPC
ncbi:hypothetical protein [Streptomyces sp. NPDC058653]|uniref:hypothetical protein n=1 Tax=Streptomyces sp. NPDC058653 TaxID=3346576 RepID=UPI003650EEDC